MKARALKLFGYSLGATLLLWGAVLLPGRTLGTGGRQTLIANCGVAGERLDCLYAYQSNFPMWDAYSTAAAEVRAAVVRYGRSLAGGMMEDEAERAV